MATCPKCDGTEMRHTLIAGSLPAHGCYRCKGVLVPLATYRDWRERSGIAKHPAKGSESLVEVSDTKDALLCGKCRNLMTKFRISADTENRIDLCHSCDEVWLDGGEWGLIEALVGAGQLANITSKPWQYRTMRNSVERMELDRLQSEFGADFDKVIEFGRILRDHPAKLEILAYLSSKSR